MRQEIIEGAVSLILKEIGEDPNRPGLKETPTRVARMYKEVFRGYDRTQEPKVTAFLNGNDGLVYNEMIIDTGNFYSHCEHHVVPFSGQYWFGYIPHAKGRLIGLSKIGRLVDYFSARLQIQERLVHDIVSHIWRILSEGAKAPLGMGMVMKAEHLCKTMRGVKKKGFMTTSKMLGNFLDNKGGARAEFLQFVSQDNTIK